MDRREILEKSIKTLKEEGPVSLAKKGASYLSYNRPKFKKTDIGKQYVDVLFVNGCTLPHPYRYRVSHQMEELQMGGMSCAEVSYQDVTEQHALCARMFILFRCPYTDSLGALISKAKSYNKKVFYDIDDLVIDQKYTDGIPYVASLPAKEKEVYDNGVNGNRKTLLLCDGVITTTEELKEQLSTYLDSVFINRNVASEDMLKYSDRALAEAGQETDGLFRIGYFSGSITHNADVKLILPVLGRLLREKRDLRLLLVGELDVPEELRPFQKKIEVLPFSDWKKLPSVIAKADINLVPLEDTVFNRAKSENKWTEAALVKVPTIASNVGALQHVIHDGEDGLLCENTEADWYENIVRLMENRVLRHSIAQRAYERVIAQHTTIQNAAAYTELIRSLMSPNIVFNVPVLQISGGQMVILRHAGFLHEAGYEVCILNDGKEPERTITFGKYEFPVIRSRDGGMCAEADTLVATLFTTEKFVAEYPRAGSRKYLVQNYEIGFNAPGNQERLKASRSYCDRERVDYITISQWCRKWLAEKYGIQAGYAPNGLDTKIFRFRKRDYSEKIRILIEGNSDDSYKNVDESFRIVSLLNPAKYEIWYVSYQGRPKAWYRCDRFFNRVSYEKMPSLYRKCHFLLKSSVLESFSYPPLEMMATGGIAVVRQNEGNIEYLRDGYNCVFYDPAHLEQVPEIIERLVRDETARNTLISNGRETALSREWENLRGTVLELYKNKEKGSR